MPTVFYQRVVLHDPIHPALYDSLLAGGWYRVQQIMMTTDFIMTEGVAGSNNPKPLEPGEGTFHYLGNEVAPVFWLRINLGKVKKIKKHAYHNFIENNFRVVIEPFEYRMIDEHLYHKYLNSIDFDASAQLYDYLFTEEQNNIFQSTAIRVFDGEELIACGIFDEANTSSAGIINFFDPAYKKYSFGKWLIRKKLELSLDQGLAFYYPGYFSTRITKFNYKLAIQPNATEVYIRDANEWVPWEETQHTNLENYLMNVMQSQ